MEIRDLNCPNTVLDTRYVTHVPRVREVVSLIDDDEQRVNYMVEYITWRLDDEPQTVIVYSTTGNNPTYI